MTKKKLRIGLVFGGQSGEHEVSLLSAQSIYQALDKEKYQVDLIGIDKNGRWMLAKNEDFLLNSDNPQAISLKLDNYDHIIPVQEDKYVSLQSPGSNRSKAKIDLFFPITHGTYGEDGCLQGMLEMLDIAYVGAGVTASAVGMDKVLMKRLWLSVGLPVAPFFALLKHELPSPKELQDLTEKFGLLNKHSLFVKPANLGSSVGISKVSDFSAFRKAIEGAFKYDTKVVVEQEIVGRELEVSVLGNHDPQASVVGEIIPKYDYYSYEAKYLDEQGAGLVIPAKLSKKAMREIQELAIQAYQSLDLSGMARVDLFMKPDGSLVLNEVNTLPGFTKISMYPKLWAASGLTYNELLDRLIDLALESKQEKDELKRDFNQA